MKKIYLLFSLLTISSYAQEKLAYKIFDAKGNKTSYEKLLKAAQKNKVVLFGELHDNPIIHWLELEFAKDLQTKKPIILGAEMFETDTQYDYNLYLSGKSDLKTLETNARVWENFRTDYLPLLDFAKDKTIPFIATNIPRKYASMVYKGGFESLSKLSPEEKRLMAKLPISFDIEQPGYKALFQMKDNHSGPNMPKAQAIKDATMAAFILKNLKDNYIFVHFNGTYHSDNYEGINLYLLEKDPEISILTIASAEQKDVDKLENENLGKADFIIVVDQDMTKTH